MDTFKAKKESQNDQLLKIKNACDALTAQAKREQEAKEIDSLFSTITRVFAEGTRLATDLANLLIDKACMFPGGRIDLDYTLQLFSGAL